MSGSALEKFGLTHAEMYREHTPPADFSEEKYNKLARRPTV
ncbi:MAG: hypothetical protein R3B47_00975 [Bacteroidia bacterium]